MKKNLSRAALMASVVGLVMACGGTESSQAADPPPAAAMAKDKVRFKITCEGADNEIPVCEVRGTRNSKPINGDEGQVLPPNNLKNIDLLVLIAEGDLPAGHSSASNQHPDGMNTAGPHCWVQVSGKWYSIHC